MRAWWIRLDLSGPRVRLRALFLGACALILCHEVTVATAAPGDPGLALEEAPAQLLARGADAFAKRDFELAARSWESVEPRLEGQAQALDRLRPLLGYAQLRSGRPAVALQTLAAWLEGVPRAEDPRLGFVAIARAEAFFQTGDLKAAVQVLDQFCADHPGDPRNPWIRWQQASWARSASDTASERRLLEELARPDVVPLVAAQASNRLLELALEAPPDERFDPAQFPFYPDIREEPAVGALCIARGRLLFRIADRLAAEGRNAEALGFLRRVPSRAEAELALKGAKLELSAGSVRAFPEPSTDLESPSIAGRQVEHWLEEAGKALAGLRGSADPVHPVRLRMAQILLSDGRHREARLLAESVVDAEGVGPEVRGSARILWAMGCLAGGDWEEALALVEEVRRSEPGSPRLRELLALAARAWQGAGKWAEAVVQLDALEPMVDDPVARFRLVLERVECRLRLRDHAAAREDLSKLTRSDLPEWRARGQLWTARVHSLERRHQEVLDVCDKTLEGGVPEAMVPDFQHRRILALRALGRTREAEQDALSWLARNPRHGRAGELALLAGDLALGRGASGEARTQYAALAGEAAPLRIHAAFQIGKTYRAESDWNSLLRHFGDFVKEGTAELPRLAEAIHWQAFALEKLGRGPEAADLWKAALEAGGDRVESLEMAAVIGRLAGMAGGAPEQIDWLEEQRAKALGKQQLTLYARLTLARSARERKLGRSGTAVALEEEIAVRVPKQKLDAAGLLAAASVLAAAEPERAVEHAERLLDLYPAATEGLEAHVLLADLERGRGNLPEAREHLRLASEQSGGHPRAWLAALARAEHSLEDGDAVAAVAASLEVLGDRAARGRPQARALRVRARAVEKEGRPEEALLLHQRLYSLHAAQADLAGAARLSAARILAATGRTPEAVRTLREHLESPSAAPGILAEARDFLMTIEADHSGIPE